METIEERAKAFCENNICVDCGDRKNCDRGCVGCSISTYSALEWLIQFGKSEHEELIIHKMKLTREELRLSYNAVCNAYLAAFCEKHGYDYEPDAWVGNDPGGIAEVGDLFVSMADMLTDIDRDAPKEEYVKYYDYCMRVKSIAGGKLETPNYGSWLRGCPRMNEEQISRLEELIGLYGTQR